MPTKIEKIRSVGRFANFSAKGDIAFKPLVSLFAPNGNGKSTLSDIFRSLQSGDHKILKGRHTLNSQDNSEVVIRLKDGKQARFDGEKWNTKCPGIVIFDDIFIEETIHSGATIEAHQRQNLHKVVIGKESVEFQHKMDAIDGAITRINAKSSMIAAKLKSLFSGFNEKEVIKIGKVDNVEKVIDDTRKLISNLENASDINKASMPAYLPSVCSPLNTSTFLSCELSDVIVAARNKVIEHLKTKEMTGHGERWISEGMKWSKDGSCPFCGQELSLSPIYPLFENYFEEEYNKIIAELEALNGDVQNYFGDKYIHRIELVVSKNNAAMTFWKDKVDAELPSLDVIREIAPKLNDAANELNALLEIKRKNPTKTVNIPYDSNWISGLNEAARLIQDYNEAVSSACSDIQLLRKSLVIGDTAGSKKRLEELLAIQLRHSEEVSGLCNQFQRYESAKKKMVDKKAEFRQELNLLSEEILSKHGEYINRCLRQFGASFGISNFNTIHPRGKATTSFDVEINECCIKTTTGEGDAPNFGNTLSTGDKRALAFAFFLSIINQDSELHDKIVLFDDPFSSLDSFRRSRTKDRILEVVGKARVVLVMSHDRDFLWHLCERAGKQQITLKIVNSNNSSVISEWDIKADMIDMHQKSVSMVRNYVDGNSSEDLLNIARSLRPVLEGMFRREFPELFSQKEWLQNMISIVESSAEIDRISRFKPALSDLADIKNYTSPFHHSDVQRDSIVIDPEELNSYANSVLFILDGHFDCGHTQYC